MTYINISVSKGAAGDPECEAMPPGCNEMKWPWAVGSEPVVFPPQAGMPMGEGRKWYALQRLGRLDVYIAIYTITIIYIYDVYVMSCIFYR